jgi:deazaflavin-dependent oxidoreductase (nitroreductase family)
METKPRPAGLDHPLVPKAMHLMQRANVWLYQRTGGRVGGMFRLGAAFPRGVPVLLLTTIGRKSGEPRIAPLLYLQDGARYVVVASKGGMPKNPLWFDNLLANPEVEVQVGREHQRMRARVASAEERAALWPKLVALYADYANYQSWTDRVIPVVLLEPRP